MKRRIDTTAIDITALAKEYRINGNRLYKAYKHVLSDYHQFRLTYQAPLKKGAFIFPKNLGTSIGIDETGLFHGDLYTIILNKNNGNGKNSLIGIIKGTKSKTVVKEVTDAIPFSELVGIRDVTIDFANNMDWISRQIVPNGRTIYDRFHLEQLMFEALQSVRIQHRWEVLEEDDSEPTERFSNGDTRRQLLARSRYLLFKRRKDWTREQAKRAVILFREYPDIEDAYMTIMEFKEFFSMQKAEAEQGMKNWLEWVLDHPIPEFRTLAKTVKKHLHGILNYFLDRKTNALLENFNGRVKQFLRQVRGSRDKDFFFFRLFKLYAW